MSCTHYRPIDSRRDELHLDFKYPHSCYTTTCHTSIKQPCSEVRRGDPPFPDSNVQIAKIANTYRSKHHKATPVVSIEKMQICLKLLEDSNAALDLRNRDLIEENKNLTRQLEKDAMKMEELQENVSLLENKINNERLKLTDMSIAKQTKNDKICLLDKCTSTDIVSKADCELQIWETCKDCHGKLESCQRELPTVTITKSEFELLEKDMQILRDAIIVREEAWDKAIERERNFQQQLARLTAETITTRHLCETRQNELCAITKALMEKESELKVMQKEALYLNKLIAKLHRHQKELEEHVGGCVSSNINEKDQRCIEEIIQRVWSSKGKSKTKFKQTSDKRLHSNSSSSRDSKNRTDQAGSWEN
ncbi:hypothetical protein ACFW04_006465 [Cataglyphis niger]